ncbi:uncharacterized protein BO97DRAFT_45763 [Aspergillus homomorphus CBS 101889]|uniref:Uncharacterized protein n=1 Tax=Aspergillus homomorphus (strain CBS 101889) TaxID=1450537 RepID=A0A395HZL1_ASPHC|nr:hypothetical protein BO97DRAFT_45763 [Aspergillus homomorphus CBS 101889]RAL13240.1 hypothetical protein BO97DRAFT_45763 [Aspergillus homomorphus CBS 101889]
MILATAVDPDTKLVGYNAQAGFIIAGYSPPHGIYARNWPFGTSPPYRRDWKHRGTLSTHKPPGYSV